VRIPTGSVHEGQQAVSSASVYLFATGTSGHGNTSISLLNPASTGNSNALGAYVTTDAKGKFVWSGDYSCTPGTQVYAYALGGNVGSVPNAAVGFLAVLGNCPSAGNFNAVPTVQINEATTVAAAYAFAGFAVDATHVASSGTALAQVGIASAFSSAPNIVSLSTGQFLATTPAGNGTVPQTTLNTLADILAACASSSGATSSACTTLFSNALAGGATGAQPTDTATAAINIAHNPGLNAAALFALVATTPPFAPARTVAPADYTIALSLTGGGISQPETIAIDGSGNVWIANQKGSSLSEFSPVGSPISGASGYTGGGLQNPTTIAVDSSGNAWTLNLSTVTLIEFSGSGAVLSGTTGFPGGGIQPGPFPEELAIDGSGNIWGASNLGAVEWSNSGNVLSGTSGYGGSSILGGSDIGIDGSGNAWVLNAPSSEITKYSSTGAILSPANGYKGGGLDFPMDIAFDSAGNAFIINFTNCTCTGAGAVTIVKLSSSGASLAGLNGFIWGGLVTPSGIAMDGVGNAWITNFGVKNSNYAGSGLLEFTNSLAIVSPNYGYTAGGVIHAPAALAIDGSGNLWTVSGNVSDTLTEIVGAAAPVVTPLATGVKNNTLGTRP
jgi:hypothetical protein